MMLKFLALAASIVMTLDMTFANPVRSGRCVSDCSGVSNGDYQSCTGCDVYVTCSNGLTYDRRPCPGDLVWDDNRKRCEWTSETCSEPSNCVSDCSGLSNGDYQSCTGCDVYVTCSNGLTYDRRPCPASLVWDDKKKRCEWVSTTCSGSQSLNTKREMTATSQCESGGQIASCLADCMNQVNGNYPSCEGCGMFVTCSNGALYQQACPGDLVWDDQAKRCEYESSSCYCVGDKRSCTSGSTGPNCVTDCAGLANGDYQSCAGCDVYVTCSNGLAYDLRPCPEGLVWDDEAKECKYSSQTCQCTGDEITEIAQSKRKVDDQVDALSSGGRCVSDCSGVSNGDYQSCTGCDVYVTCSNGLTYDRRPCPGDLVWDDNRKRCEWTSETCNDRPSNCVSDCSGLSNGDYQSCTGCDVYVTCSNGLTYDRRPCPASLVWDDNRKRCEWVSPTCP